MSGPDRLRILDQIGRYSFAAGGDDGEAFAALCADGGTLEVWQRGADAPLLRVRGREAIARFVEAAIGERPPGVQTRLHQHATMFDQLNADSTRTGTMLLATRSDPGDAEPKPVASGVHSEQWVRTDGAWLLALLSSRADRSAAPAEAAAASGGGS